MLLFAFVAVFAAPAVRALLPVRACTHSRVSESAGQGLFRCLFCCLLFFSIAFDVGYFCFEPEVFNHICEGNVEIEAGLLMPLAEKRLGLTAFFHSGQWMPIDTQRELLDANKLWDEGNAFW